MIIDLLLGSDKSILVLGEPGSGKTTIIREAIRRLSERMNVVVVDTSNEIAGDGIVPHDCIGFARRMMVRSLDAQSDVMVECVQNHTPRVMVIDEIGRPKEVKAARTYKQHNVRLINTRRPAPAAQERRAQRPRLRHRVGHDGRRDGQGRGEEARR